MTLGRDALLSTVAMIGWPELLAIVVIVMLIVGGRKLPELGRSLGQAIREFQRALRGGSHDDEPPTEKR